MPMIKSLLLLFILALSTQAAQAKVKIPAVFGSNAILQRGVPVKVWGWSEPNANIEGVLQGNNTSKHEHEKIIARADKLGKFHLVFKPKEAGGPYTLSISDEHDKAQSQNLYFGEVWLCSGQSNFLTSLSEEKLLADATKEGFSPTIRFFAPEPHLNTTPEYDNDTQWQVMDEKTAPDVSALAYYFSNKLQKTLNVPVGLLLCAAPGAKVQSLSRMQGLRAFREGRAALADFNINFPEAGASPEKLDFPHEVHRILIEKGGEKNKEDMEKVKSRSFLLFKSATSIYNTMIAPVAGYPIKGVLWYQGETNMREPATYLSFFTGLVQDWRNVWEIPKMPFLFVQMPPFGERGPAPNLFSVGAIFRNIQSKASLYPYTFMVPAIDSCNNEKNPNFHASNKKLLGARLCNAALATQYGKPAIYRAPKVEECQLEGNKVRVTFKYIGKGLKVNGTAPKGFAIAGGDKKLHWAQARLDGDSVLVWSPEVDKPKIITYAWDNNPEVNLFSLDSLPVDPFREELTVQKR